MKKILFPFELKNPSNVHAFAYAVKLARSFEAEMIMLNVFNFPYNDSITQEKYDQQVREHRYKAYQEILRYNKHYLNNYASTGPYHRIRFDYRFIYGDLWNEVRGILQSEAVDLLVLPMSKSKEHIRRQRDIVHTDLFEKNMVSVLAVPGDNAYTPIKKIAFALDMKRLENHELYIQDITEIADVLDASIHFLHICPDADSPQSVNSEMFKAIQELLKKDRRHVLSEVAGRDIVETIERYNEENAIELLVVVKKHHFYLSTLFRKSISDEVTFRSRIPVMIMREKST